MPIKHVFSSMPVYALIILHFGNNWGLYFLLTAAPKFMNEALGFKLSKAGYLAALPYLARLLSGFMFGAVGDYVRSKKLMSVTFNRKFFTIFCKFLMRNELKRIELVTLNLQLMSSQAYF